MIYFYYFLIEVTDTFYIKEIIVDMSTRTKDELGTLSLLGNKKTVYKDDYAPEVLETFPNKHPENDYFVKFNCPEFTSLCPITGQPDFATIYISYVPGERMVESKSLKLYLYSFRNHGDFHEDCMNIIMKDLIRLMDPKYIEVWGKFTPRGGISIDPYCNYGKAGTLWEQVAFQRLTQHDLYPEKIVTGRLIYRFFSASQSHTSGFLLPSPHLRIPLFLPSEF